MRQVIHLEPYRFAGSWLVATKSHLMDRFVPQVELIYWPGGVYTGTDHDLVLTAGTAPETRRSPSLTPAARLRRRGRGAPVDLGGRLAIELRSEAFFNWAHHLLTYLPLSLLLRERLAPGEVVTALFHAKMPAIMLTLYRQFGFEAIATDAPVRAVFLEWKIGDYNAVSTRIHEMVRPHLHHVAEPAETPARARPPKIFLSRRSGRAIRNATEIEAILAEYGYVTI